MPITVLKPNAIDTTHFSDNVAANTGTDQGAVSDGSDSTYVRRSGGVTAYPMVIFDVPTTAISATQLLIGVGAGVRAKSVANKLAYTYQVYINGDWQAFYCPEVPAGTSAIGTYEPALISFGLNMRTSSVGPWTQAGIDALRIMLADRALGTDADRAYVYETWLSVYTLNRPSTNVSAPSGTVTSDGAPSVVLDVSNIVETWQTAQPGYAVFLPGGSVEVRLFTEAQATASGFDPATTTPIWSGAASYTLQYIDGSATSTCPAITIPTTQLENGEEYRAYARASIDGTPQPDPWGSWDYSSFTLDLDTVDAPVFDATPVDADQRVALTWEATAKAGHSDPTVTVQRSEDVGATWQAVRSLTDLPTAFAEEGSAWDYEAPRGVDVLYRARITTTYTGSRVASPWTVAEAITLAATGWNLKVPQQPALNAIGVHVIGEISEDYFEEVSVQRPKGRSRPVVLAAAIDDADLPADGSLTFRTDGDAAWLAVRPALRHQGPLYLEMPYRTAKWVRLVVRSLVTGGVASAPRRRITVSYVEVDPAPEA